MSSRDAILERIRQAGRAKTEHPEVPHFNEDKKGTAADFEKTLTLMGGVWLTPAESVSIEDNVRTLFPEGSKFCSVVTEVKSDYDLRDFETPADLEPVDIGVVRARYGVAETGSLWISEDEFKINTLGYFPQHLVALLDPQDIVYNLHEMYARTDFHEVNYCVLMTGPSATADIQGVLIHGAQGVRSLTVIPCPKPE